eukprot:XP_012810537.1 PREDICTED: lamin-B receptor-like [Xenopus tropicalis]
MGVAWCLPCGFNHIAPYFYAIFLLVLLLDRVARDEQRCREKYGPDWDKYCKHIKSVELLEEEEERNEKVLRYSLSPQKESSIPKGIVLTDSGPTESLPETAEKNAENPKLAFGGTVGCLLFMICFPALLYCLLVACGPHSASVYPSLELLDAQVFGFFVLWILLQASLAILPLGKVVDGVQLGNGSRLKYRMNGIHVFFLTAATAAAMMYYYKINILYVYEHYLQFAASATLFSLLFSVYLYVRSYRVPNEELSWTANSGLFANSLPIRMFI